MQIHIVGHDENIPLAPDNSQIIARSLSLTAVFVAVRTSLTGYKMFKLHSCCSARFYHMVIILLIYVCCSSALPLSKELRLSSVLNHLRR